MKILNCIIGSTDERSSAILEEYMNKLPYLNLVREDMRAPYEGRRGRQEGVDLVFWDIDRADTGARVLQQYDPLPLLICLAGSAASVQQPDTGLDVFSFLHRPFTFERFLSIVTNARKYLQALQSPDPAGKRNFLFVKSEYKIIKVRFDEILFCEGMKDYTQIYLKGRSTPLLTLQNQKSFYSKLPGQDFVRVHRSYVVSLACIDTIARNEIAIGKKLIPIGESFRDHFFDIVQHHS